MTWSKITGSKTTPDHNTRRLSTKRLLKVLERWPSNKRFGGSLVPKNVRRPQHQEGPQRTWTVSHTKMRTNTHPRATEDLEAQLPTPSIGRAPRSSPNNLSVGRAPSGPTYRTELRSSTERLPVSRLASAVCREAPPVA